MLRTLKIHNPNKVGNKPRNFWKEDFSFTKEIRKLRIEGQEAKVGLFITGILKISFLGLLLPTLK